MSLSEKKDVPQLVKNYRRKYPDLDRDLLRKLIRLELKIGNNPSELKKLDRYLGKAFKNEVKLSTKQKPSKEKIENEYLELAPENALIVARIDFFLENFIDKNDQKNKEFLTMVKLLRDYHVKVGKALGRQ